MIFVKGKEEAEEFDKDFWTKSAGNDKEMLSSRWRIKE